jgi:hypothetical protein
VVGVDAQRQRQAGAGDQPRAPGRDAAHEEAQAGELKELAGDDLHELLGVRDLRRRRGEEERREQSGSTTEQRRHRRIQQDVAQRAENDAGQPQRRPARTEQPERGGDGVVRQRVEVAVRVGDDLKRRVDLAVEHVEGEQPVDCVVAPQAGRVEPIETEERRQREDRDDRCSADTR